MALIDTNIIPYLLIDGEHTEAAQRLRRSDPDWRSEAFLMVEFTNVLARYISTGKMSMGLGRQLLSRAEALLDGKLGHISHAEAVAGALYSMVWRTGCTRRGLNAAPAGQR